MKRKNKITAFLYRLALVTLLFILSGSIARAQSAKFLSFDQGLTSSLINAILCDSNGRLWIGTENGLTKYDGVKFTSYYHIEGNPHSLCDNYVRAIFEDNQGRLFIGAYTGLQMYNPETDDFSEPAVTEDGGRYGGVVNNIIQKANGDILITGENVCTVNVSKGCLTVKYVDYTIPTKVLEGIIEDHEGNIWITKETSGVFRMNKDRSSASYFTNSGTDPVVTCISEDMKGNIIVGTNQNGAYIYDKGKDQFISLGNGTYMVRDIMPINDEEVLICTDGNGVKCYNNQTSQLSSYIFEAKLIDPNKAKVHCATKDKNGNIWFGLYQQGALMVPSQKSAFKYIGHFSVANDLIGNCCTTALYKDEDGTLYVGTDGDGLFILSDNNTESKHLTPSNCKNMPSIILNLYKDSDGNLWMGTYGQGGAILNTKTLNCVPITGLKEADGETARSVYGFAEDNNGHIWIATMGGGLHSYEKANKQTYRDKHINSLINNWIVCIKYSERTNSVLIGTYGGFWRIGLSDYGNDNEEIIPNAIFYDVHEDKDGIIWIGSSVGVVKWNRKAQQENQKVTILDHKNGLPSDFCYAIEEDKDSCLWVSTSYGLSKINKNTLEATNYYADDGLQGNEFCKNTKTKDISNGDIYFGGLNGISWFNPKDVKPIDHTSNLYVSDFYVSGEPIKVGTKSGHGNIVDVAVSQATDFFLSPKDKVFTIEISTDELDKSGVTPIYYSVNYGDWQRLQGGSNQVSFSSLHPGSYNFRFKTHDDGIDGDIHAITVHIAPWWWQTWWFALIALFIILIAAYYIAVMVRRRSLIKEKMLQHMQAERTSELKLQFLTNVSHEIRTPMTLIVNPLQQLMCSDKDEDRQKNYKLIERNANRIMKLINELLDIRKLDHGQLIMKMHETELCGFISNIAKSFESAISSKHIALNIHKIGLEELHAWIDESHFDKVIINLISNAVKYTPENGHIDIYIKKLDEPSISGPLQHAAEIIVQDNGRGIPEDDLDKVFDRFFQAKNSDSAAPGSGVGLHLTKNVVQLHHGTIDVENNSDGNSGCKFTVRIPLGNAHLTRDEMNDNKILVKKSIDKNNNNEDSDITDNSNAIGEKSVKDNVEKVESYSTEKAKDKPKATSSANKQRLLIVEDDEEIRSYLQDQLSRNYNIMTCGNGAEALKSIQQKAPNIIISDVMMPEMDGFTLCKKIRQNIQFNDLPIILLTAKTLEEDQIRGLEIGADAYITKPFDVRVLKQTVTNLLKSRQNLKNIYSGNQTQDSKIDKIEATSPDEKLMNKVLKIINENISNPNLSVEMIADEIGISRVHLHRKLKALTNQTTRDFIRNIRLTQAAKLLKEKKMPVSEIAYNVGFSSPAHFTSSFKDIYGVSPSAYANAEENKTGIEE